MLVEPLQSFHQLGKEGRGNLYVGLFLLKLKDRIKEIWKIKGTKGKIVNRKPLARRQLKPTSPLNRTWAADWAGKHESRLRPGFGTPSSPVQPLLQPSSPPPLVHNSLTLAIFILHV